MFLGVFQTALDTQRLSFREAFYSASKRKTALELDFRRAGFKPPPARKAVLKID